MGTQNRTGEADIREQIDRWTEAVRAMDLEAVMSIYAPNIVSFDVETLRYFGTEAKRKAWESVFGMYQRAMSQLPSLFR